MALTKEQLLLINNLLYSTDPSIYGSNPQTSYQGRTVGELVQAISPSGNATGTASAAEWEQIVSQIRSDPQLMDMRFENTYYDKSTKDAGCCLVDPSTNEAVVAFRGTGSGEWRDNFIAGTSMNNGNADPTISTQQQSALDYVNSLDLSQYDTVTVTGHSKGGNKAKICALLNDGIDRCVSFDGQGFSDEFMEAHMEDIVRNQSKIENHNVDGDFVNILLNDVGTVTYYEGQRVGDNFPKNHDPSTFWTADGKMVEGKQNREMKELDKYLNSMLRSMNEEDRAAALEFAGEIANAALGTKDNGDIREVLLDPRYRDSLAYILAYTIEYERETGKVTESVAKAFERMGITDFNTIIDVAGFIVGNDTLYSIVKSLLQNADGIPDWVLEKIRSICGFFGKEIPFTDAELRALLQTIAKGAKLLDEITVKPNSGKDIQYDSGQNTEKPSWWQGLNLFGNGGVSGPDRIKVSTDRLDRMARELNQVQNSLSGIANQLNRISIPGTAGGRLRLEMSVAFHSGVNISGGELTAMVHAMADALRASGQDAGRLSAALAQTSQRFQATEQRIQSDVRADIQ